MKLSNAIVGFAALLHGINAVALPEANSLDVRAPEPESQTDANQDLFKRKGGGGGGGRGGSSGGRGGSSSGGSSGGSRGGSSSSPSSTSNNKGGQTTTGSGARPMYGGGAYYGGGATIPYKSGDRLKHGGNGLLPGLLVGTAIGGIIFTGFALSAAYNYPYTHQYPYYNTTTDKNETKPVECICSAYNPCGCDDTGNMTWFNSVIGDGSYQGSDKSYNHSLVVVTPNSTTGNDTIYINGILPNGTTAAGGTEDPNSADALIQTLGWWPVAGTALAMAFML